MTSSQPKQSQAERLASLPKAKIVKRTDLTDDLFIVWLETGVPFTFKAGQYITIGSHGLERPYSIASAPYESLVELFIEYILPEHGGKLTPHLWAHKEGDEVSMRPRAKGIFTFQPQYKDHVMVSTVTGVAPFVSMIRQYLHDGLEGHRFFIMEGASHMNEFIYDGELGGLAEKYPDSIVFLPSVSRPKEALNAEWTGLTGRINTLVEDHLEKWGLKKENTLVYTCGHPMMIEDVKERLTPKGWSVQEERFWKEEGEE